MSTPDSLAAIIISDTTPDGSVVLSFLMLLIGCLLLILIEVHS